MKLKKLKKFDLEYNPCDWWLRSVNSYYSHYVGYVYTNGNVHNDIATYNYGVLPAFIII